MLNVNTYPLIKPLSSCDIGLEQKCSVFYEMKRYEMKRSLKFGAL